MAVENGSARWRRGLARLAAQGRAKLVVFGGLAVGICVPYFSLQRLQSGPFTTLPTALDGAIPFRPDWIWVYVTIALLVPLAPGLATRRAELERYARGLALLCVGAFVTFALLPVAGPRPELAPDHALYGWIAGVDRPTNSFPSLHAGLSVYSLLFAARVARGSGSRALRSAPLWLGLPWVALILYSTVATKQHWLVDVPAGALLAALAHGWAWRAPTPALTRASARTPTAAAPTRAPSPRAPDTARAPTRSSGPR